MRWLELEHALDEVFELLGEELVLTRLALRVVLPEKIGSVGGYHFVKWVALLGGCEWGMLCNHDE